MTLSYQEVFSDFLGRIKDYEISGMDSTDVYAQMTEWLRKALSEPYVRRLFSSISLEDSTETINYEMDFVVDEEADKEFVKNIASKGMVVEWITPQVNKTSILSQLFTGKEQKFFSQSQHLSELRALLEDTKTSLRKTIRDRGYIYNTYLEA